MLSSLLLYTLALCGSATGQYICSGPSLSSKADWQLYMQSGHNDMLDCSGSPVASVFKVDRGVKATIVIEDRGAVFRNVRFIVEAGGRLEFTGDDGSFMIADNTIDPRSSVDGGAILVRGELVINVPVKFFNNQARAGGAIAVEAGGSLTLNAPATFAFNTAEIGGAVDVNDASNFTTQDIVFIENRASAFGGAFSCTTPAALSDGAVPINIEGTATFIANDAGSYSGAFDADACAAAFHGNVNFKANTANTSGGAVAAFDRSIIEFKGAADFTGNSAELRGGGMSVHTESSIMFTGSAVEFTANIAGNEGGAVSVESDSTVVIDGAATFTSNTADTNGDNIFLSAFSRAAAMVVFSGESTFNTGLELGDNVYSQASEVARASVVFVKHVPAFYGPTETFAYSNKQLMSTLAVGYYPVRAAHVAVTAQRAVFTVIERLRRRTDSF